MEQQDRHHLVVGGVEAVVQARERCLAQVQAVVARIEARVQLLDA